MGFLPAVLVAHAKVAVAITTTTAVAAGGGFALSTKVGERGSARQHAVVQTVPETEPTDPSDDDAIETPETDPSEQPEAEPSDEKPDGDEAGESPEDPKDKPGREEAPDVCPPGLRNHGDYVSMIAKLAPKSPAGAHGKVVSEAAKSSCGKKAKHEDGDDDDQGENHHKGESDHKGESEHKDGKKTDGKKGAVKKDEKPKKSHGDKGKREKEKGSDKR